jgi:hypothetical protein
MEVLSPRAVVPAELLQRVLRLLPLPALLAAVQVCRWWRAVGAAPVLWSWSYLRVDRGNLACMARVLASGRLLAVERLEVWAVSKELLQAVARHHGLRVLDMGGTNMSAVNPQLLARAALGPEVVNMWNASLTCEQLAAILSAIDAADGETRLRKLNLRGNRLSADPRFPEAVLLASAVTRLEEVNLEMTWPTREQMDALLTAVGKGSRLKNLNLSHSIVFSAPALLAEAVHKLEELNLEDTRLTRQQVESILTASLRIDSKLKRMNLSDNGTLSEVDTSLLARAVNNLEEVNLHGVFLLPQQVEAILTGVTRGSRLRKLDIRESIWAKGPAALALLEPDLLARAVTRLEEVSLSSQKVSLSRRQVEAILGQAPGGALRRLDMGLARYDVDCDLISQAQNAGLIGDDWI